MPKLKPVTLYRCEILEPHRFSEERPDCSNCHTQSCMYNVGFSDEPRYITKEAFVDEKGNYVEADGTPITQI